MELGHECNEHMKRPPKVGHIPIGEMLRSNINPCLQQRLSLGTDTIELNPTLSDCVCCCGLTNE